MGTSISKLESKDCKLNLWDAANGIGRRQFSGSIVNGSKCSIQICWCSISEDT